MKFGQDKIANVIDPLRLFTEDPLPVESKEKKPLYMPATDDQKAMAAKRRSRQQSASRRGRASTVNTAMGTLG